MTIREQDDLPYRTAGSVQNKNVPVTKNEENYDTLRIVKELLDLRIEGLYRDFNAFGVLNLAESTKARAAEELLLQIEAKKIAYDVLIEAVQALETALQGVKQNYNKRNTI